MGERPTSSEEMPEEKNETESYAQKMIREMKENLQKEQASLEGRIIDLQGIREKVSRGEVVTKEERDLLEKSETKIIRDIRGR